MSFRSPVTTYFWILCFSILRFQSLELTTCLHPRISVTSYFQTSSKDILLSVSLPHFSCPPCLEYLCPRALILRRLWRCINHVLTYLVTLSAVLKINTKKSPRQRVEFNRSKHYIERMGYKAYTFSWPGVATQNTADNNRWWGKIVQSTDHPITIQSINKAITI